MMQGWLYLFALCVGVVMFVHYGSAVLKHPHEQSGPFMKWALLLTVVFSVQIIRAAAVRDDDHLIFGLAAFCAVQTTLSLYLWTFGMSYRSASKRLHALGGFSLRSLWARRHKIL